MKSQPPRKIENVHGGGAGGLGPDEEVLAPVHQRLGVRHEGRLCAKR